MELGKDVSDDELNQRVKLIVPNKCASLIYTVISFLLNHWLNKFFLDLIAEIVVVVLLRAVLASQWVCWQDTL